jgi:flagellar motor switch protein FliG
VTTLAKLKTLNDLQIHEWLKRVEKAGVPALVYAMLGADEDVKNCVFKNMSKHASNMLKADIEKSSKLQLS